MSASRGRSQRIAIRHAAGSVLCALLVAASAGSASASPLTLFNAASANRAASIGDQIVGAESNVAFAVTSVPAQSRDTAFAFSPDDVTRLTGADASSLIAGTSRQKSAVGAAVFAGSPALSVDADANLSTSLNDAASVPGAIAGLAFQVAPGRGSDNDADDDLQPISGSPIVWPGAGRQLFAFENVPAANGVSVGQQLDSIALGDPNAGPLLSAAGDVPLQAAPLSPLSGGASAGSRFAQASRGPDVQLELPLTLGNVDARLSLSGRSVQNNRPSGLSPGSFNAPAVSSLSSQYQELRGGVTVGVPVFKHQAQVSLDGVFSRLVNDSGQTIADNSAPPPALGLYGPSNAPATSALAGLSAYQNLATGRQYVGAYSVALPIGKALTANMQYVDQRFGGDPLNSVTSGVNVQKITSTFGVLYKIPNTNAAINLNFNQSTFENDQLPGYNWVQNRQNLFFTVKF
ncbi:MAG TPA: hypothetical protein VKT51_03220 [Candidatus Eremiobacteraceae bacterium]|nr:hypothetical protein [Candidatus Eremiobacteraceae bacterium]